MQKKVIIFILLFSNIIIIIGFWYYKRKVDYLLEYYDNVIEQKTSESIRLKMLENDIKTYLSTEMYPIEPNIKLISNEGNVLSLQDIVSDTPKLVIRYSYLNCDACVQFQLNILNKFFPEFKRENIIVLASHESLREMKFFNEVNQVVNSIYNVDEEIIPIIEKNNEPYFFIIDKTLKAKQIFIPRKELPEFSMFYLKNIKECFSCVR